MSDPWIQLQQAFNDEHQSLMAGYLKLLRLLDERDFGAAAREASRLDTIAGPHIEFEEKYLYPELEKGRGGAFTTQLYHEHDEFAAVLIEIEGSSADVPTDARLAAWKKQLRLAIDHTRGCGSMFSELKKLPAETQRLFLDGLVRLRDKGSRWSELVSSPAR